MIIAQKLGALSIDCINDVTVEEVAGCEAREDFRNLFWIIAASLQRWKELVLVKTVKRLDVAEDSMLHPSEGLWQLFSLKYCRVVADAGLEGSHVVLLILEQLSHDVVELRGNAEKYSMRQGRGS